MAVSIRKYIYRSRDGISRCGFVIAAFRAIFNWARTRLFWGIIGANGADAPRCNRIQVPACSEKVNIRNNFDNFSKMHGGRKTC